MNIGTDIELPSVPMGVLTLLSVFAPYGVAVINHPRWTSRQKKIVSIVVPLVLAAAVWVIYYAMTGDGLHSWPVMLLLGVGITQASYALVVKDSAKAVSEATHTD